MRLFALTALILISTASMQSQTAQSQTAAKTGPAIGTHVPDFEAVDQNGQTHSLRSIMGAKGAMLVFFRSADW